MTTLTVATCRFPVSGDIGRNADWITRQIAEATDRGGGGLSPASCTAGSWQRRIG